MAKELSYFVLERIRVIFCDCSKINVTLASSLGNFSKISVSKINKVDKRDVPNSKLGTRPMLSWSRRSRRNQKILIVSFIYDTFKVDIPPSTPMVWPVTQVLLSLRRNTARFAISSASPTRLSGCLCDIISRFLVIIQQSAGQWCVDQRRSDAVDPYFLGHILRPRDFANPSIAPLAAATLV